ncbi:MAG TPA: mercuric reductase [Bryobacteraceae bacterium]|nr:mercuric reductase [Bryobacteraceae bacterium]
MPDPATFDIMIVGGGQAATPLAFALAKAGKRVALAERRDLGGSCVNFGCIPTKAAIASAKVAHLARRAAEYGLRVPQVEVDFAAVLRRAGDIALESRTGLDRLFEKSENPKLLRGHARFLGPGFRLQVGEAAVSAAQVVVDTGNRTAIPSIPGLDKIKFLDAGNWLHRPELPERLAMIGGSYIGLEMAQFYRRMGSQVAVWETSPRIAAHEDPDISTAIQQFLESEGIVFHLGAHIASIDQLNATHVFIAAGRKPNTGDLGLETVGVETDAHGYIKIDRRLATSVPGIWVAGDARGGPQFTHTSWDDYRILLSQIAGDGSRTTDRIVPYAMFTDPELARVGLTETAAREKGLKFRVSKFEMKKNGKAREIGEPDGFIKVLLEEDTGKILGAALLCSNAAELIHMYIDIVNAGASSTVIRDAIHIHPTLAEAVQSAVT